MVSRPATDGCNPYGPSTTSSSALIADFEKANPGITVKFNNTGKPAMDVLMEDTHFGTIYDADQLARNEVPLQAAVYFDDMYVDSGLQFDTLSRVGRSHYWTTNEFEHDGVHGSVVFKHLFDEALNRGDLEELF